MTLLRSTPWLSFFALSLGFFLVIIDTTIVNIAIPSIMSQLNAGLDEILWIINAYILVYATLLIVAGRLGDLIGPRRLYIAGIALFILSSVFCGFAQEASQLIVARVFQGVGAALLSPQTLAILITIFPKDRQGIAFGAWSAVAGIASTAGPILGGLIVTQASWRWIFFINLPIGILALVLTFLLVPDLYPNQHHRLDLTGVALGSISILAIAFGLIEGQRYHWDVVWGLVTIPSIIVFGVVTLIVFILWELTRKEPLIPLSLFRDRNFTIMSGVVAAISFGIIGLLLVMTIYLQSVLGMTAFQTGLTIAPLSIVAMLIAPFAGRLTDQMGGKYLVLAGLLLFAFGIALITWLSEVRASKLLFLCPIILGGLGIGCIMAPSTTIAMRDISPQVIGVASGVFNTARQMGSVFGSAITGSILQSKFTSVLQEQASIYSNQIPVNFRSQFIHSINEVSKKGLEVIGKSNVLMFSGDLPQQIEQQFQLTTRQIFDNSFIIVMKSTLMVIVVVLLFSAFSCLAVIEKRKL